MNTSLQAAGGRHLAPAVSPYVWRALVWAERDGQWILDMVFDMPSFEGAEMAALDATTEPWEPGVTNMHFIIGEVEQ